MHFQHKYPVCAGWYIIKIKTDVFQSSTKKNTKNAFSRNYSVNRKWNIWFRRAISGDSSECLEAAHVRHTARLVPRLRPGLN
jgi:hypothetical protein